MSEQFRYNSDMYKAPKLISAATDIAPLVVPLWKVLLLNLYDPGFSPKWPCGMFQSQMTH